MSYPELKPATRTVTLLALAAAVGACVQVGTPSRPVIMEPLAAPVRPLERMAQGRSANEGSQLASLLDAAAAYPLGSRENPVRAQGPQGQRDYLSRLRCSDASPPTFERDGNVGVGPFGNIIDVYAVTCAQAQPAERKIYLDMYHQGYVEARPVDGYDIIGRP